MKDLAHHDRFSQSGRWVTRLSLDWRRHVHTRRTRCACRGYPMARPLTAGKNPSRSWCFVSIPSSSVVSLRPVAATVGTSISATLGGALWDLPTLAFFLGQPLNSVRRWIHHPPAGFPKPVEIGRKITFRAAEVRRWAEGTATSPSEDELTQPSQISKRRGRPRNQAKESKSQGG